ncbi:MAG: hypothetical protein WC523_04980 [Patescibacteria group bacterium]
MKYKKCSKCNTYKKTKEFSLNRRDKSGFCRMCKNCTKKYKKEYYQLNRDYILDKSKKRAKINKKKIKKYKANYYKNNKLEISKKIKRTCQKEQRIYSKIPKTIQTKT